LSNPKNQSFSRMNTFANKCERCHAFDALLPRQSNPAFAKGTQVHDVLEAMGQMMIDGMTVDEAVAACLRLEVDGPLPIDKLSTYIIRGGHAMKHTQPVEVEKWFDKNPDFPRLVGKIDLISDRIPLTDRRGNIIGSEEGRVILDHKTTNSSAYIKTEAEARISLQPAIYSLIEECDAVGYLWFLPAGPPRATIIKHTKVEKEVARIFVRDTMDIIEERWAQAAATEGQGPSHLQLKGYNLAKFSLGSEETPFINSSTSRHREYCLGIK